MPDNKKPFFRYSTINRCLRNTAKKYSFEQLLEAVNTDLSYRGYEQIGKTTFYQDIKDLQVEFNAPIETYWEGRKKIYRYTDPDYSFGNQPLNMDEIEHLKDAVLILSRFSGLPGFEWIDELVSKLEIGMYEESGDPNVISFESNEFLKGKEFIGRLFKAIVNKKVLKIRYKKFEASEEKTHLIHPYHLKEFDNRWYLFGYLPKREVLIPLGLDRILEISELPEKEFIENSRYNFTEYFEDIVGITMDSAENLTRIKLKFSPLMSEYVATKPLHGSQRLIATEADGSQAIQIEVIPNHELDNIIFSYKDGVEVLEPEDYRLRIIELLKNTRQLYGDG